MTASVGSITPRLILCASLLAVARPAWSASQHGASVNWQAKVRDQTNGGFLLTDGDAAGQIDGVAAQASISHSFPDPPVGDDFHSFVGAATSTAGSMGARSFLHLASNHDYGQQAVGFELESVAGSGLTLDDLVFTGPPGATSVATRLRLSVDGFVSARYARVVSGTILLAGVGVSARLADQLLAGFNVDQTGGQSAPIGVNVHSEHATIPPDAEILTTGVDGSFVSREVTVPLGAPQTLQLGLTTRAFAAVARVEGMSDFDIQLTSDFSQTLRLPSSGPIFDLPDGYSVGSASGLIVDNHLGGTTNTTTTTGVPSTTNTTSTTPSTTTTTSTTTTLPASGCAEKVGLAAIDCACASGLPVACLGRSIPRSVTHSLAAACAAARAAGTSSGRPARRLLAKASRHFGQVARRVAKPSLAKKLQPPCTTGLRALVQDLKTRVDGVRQGLGSSQREREVVDQRAR